MSVVLDVFICDGARLAAFSRYIFPIDKPALIRLGHSIVIGWLLSDKPQVRSDIVGGLDVIIECNPFPDHGIRGLTGSDNKALHFISGEEVDVQENELRRVVVEEHTGLVAPIQQVMLRRERVNKGTQETVVNADPKNIP